MIELEGSPYSSVADEYEDLSYKARMATYKQLESLLSNQRTSFNELLSESVAIVS